MGPKDDFSQAMEAFDPEPSASDPSTWASFGQEPVEADGPLNPDIMEFLASLDEPEV